MKHSRSFIRNPGFTLLELVIVIVVIGVLASLALPRFSKIIERSRGTEAIMFFTQVRPAMEMCYFNTRDYSKCHAAGPNPFANIGLSNPSSAPNSHFTYSFFPTANSYVISAARNTHEAIYPNTSGLASCSFPEGTVSSPEPSSVYLCVSPSTVYTAGVGIYEGM